MDSRSTVLDGIGTLIKCLGLLAAFGDAAPESFSPVTPIGLCPGETANFTCTVVDSSGPPSLGSVVWTGSAFDDFQCANGDEITLFTANFWRGTNESCVNGAVAQATKVDGHCFTSNLTVTLSLEVNGKTIECRLSTITVGRPYSLSVAGPLNAPAMKGVKFAVPRQQFTIQWDDTTVVSAADVTGFVLTVQGPSGLMCGDTRSDPNAIESRCSWPPSAVGQTFNFSVSALNCGSQEGLPSEIISVTLRVPEAPTLSICPVYDQSTGELQRIDSTSTTVPAVTIANGVDGSPDAYIFSYNGVPQPPVSSGQCTGGTCTDEFTPTDPTVSQYTVSVTARNVVGEGPVDTAGPIDATNNLLEVMVDVDNSTLQCRFLHGFIGTAACQIEYSTREDLSGSVVDTGSSTSGDTVTVTLTARLEERTIYYYLVTATVEGGSVSVQGHFPMSNGDNTASHNASYRGLLIAGLLVCWIVTGLLLEFPEASVQSSQ